MGTSRGTDDYRSADGQFEESGAGCMNCSDTCDDGSGNKFCSGECMWHYDSLVPRLTELMCV